MPLWKDGPMAVYCENCWANVRIGIKTSITGSFWRGYETTSTILGRVDVNADFKAVLGQGLRKNFNLDLDLTPLVEKVLPGFTLPGIISVGPELLLGASLDINGNIGATARLGFDASVSYGTLNVNELVKTQQVAPKNWDAQFNIHQPRVEVAEAAVTLTANVVPEVGLRLWLLETYRENVGVYTDVNGVAKLTALGSNNPYCKNLGYIHS
ncbi:hypothetical protein BKA69DRAFT_377906 [Paraphysoderma sedebokerense]|nr:hypothetical protein BKA69DRAFT_377906 [Paraphysoderma sedebokerense]